MDRGVAPKLLAIGLVLGACRPAPDRVGTRTEPPVAPPPSASVAAREAPEEIARLLPVPPRSQAPESPPSGWCGETAIQEGLLHLGVWAPQRAINVAGRPSHPDLYSPDVPVALAALGVDFERYRGPRGFAPFARWLRTALDEGDPVLAGVKILPTQHPEWGLDHFVLVVGYGLRGLLVNTTWGHRAWIAEGVKTGLSLDGGFYGLRLRRVRTPLGTRPARLVLLEETSKSVRLRIVCGDGDEEERTITADRVARFHCPR